MKQTLITTLILLISITPALALECLDKPKQIGSDINADIQANADLLSKYIGDAGFTGKVKRTQKDFYHKYPYASQLTVDLAFIYSVCTGLRDDSNMTEEEKTNKLIEFRKGFIYRKNELIMEESSIKWEKSSVLSEYSFDAIQRIKKKAFEKCGSCIHIAKKVVNEELGGGPTDFVELNGTKCSMPIRLIVSKQRCGTYRKSPINNRDKTVFTPGEGREFADFILYPGKKQKIDISSTCGFSAAPVSCG